MAPSNSSSDGVASSLYWNVWFAVWLEAHLGGVEVPWSAGMNHWSMGKSTSIWIVWERMAL